MARARVSRTHDHNERPAQESRTNISTPEGWLCNPSRGPSPSAAAAAAATAATAETAAAAAPSLDSA